MNWRYFRLFGVPPLTPPIELEWHVAFKFSKLIEPDLDTLARKAVEGAE